MASQTGRGPKNGLTQKILKELISYNSVAGEWRWLVYRRPKVKPGQIAGHVKISDGRRRICVNGKAYYSGPLAWFYMTGSWPKYEIDHKNRIRDDDRWDNLREATTGENQGNKATRKDNATGLKGVRKVSKNRFQAKIMRHGKSYNLGCYENPHDAALAYANKARELFGKFADPLSGPV